MNEDPSSEHSSWFERLVHLFQHKPHSRSELIQMLREARDERLMNADALLMIEGVLHVSETQARDVMVPRPRMVVIEQDATLSEALSLIVQSAHSRFPVIGENRDEVTGILLAKDLLRFWDKAESAHTKIKEFIRPATFIPESKRLDILLREFRLNRNHMAVVVNEYGGIAGLITIEDVLEEIVGEIEDEKDLPEVEPNIKRTGSGQYAVKALTPIEEFNRIFSLELSDEDFDTIGGYLTQQLGHLPKVGESVTIGHFQLTVARASKRRIYRINVSKIR